MDASLKAILDFTRRRAFIARLCENVALCAAAGGLASAVLQVAWGIWWTSPAAATALAGSLALLAAATASRPGRLILHLDGRPVWAVCGLLAGGAIAGVAAIVTGHASSVPAVFLPAAFLASAILGGIVLAVLDWPHMADAASWLDRSLGLRERMTTAVEMAGRGSSAPPGAAGAAPAPSAVDPEFAAVVTAQAVEMATKKGYRSVKAWRRTSATGGAAALAVLLCLTLLLVPMPGAARMQAISDLAGNFDSLNADDRDKLAASLKKQAGEVDEADVRAALLKAADAVANGDVETMKRELIEASDKIDIKLIVPPEVLAKIHRGDSSGGGSQAPSPTPAVAPTPAATQIPIAPTPRPARPEPGEVYVFDPNYSAKAGNDGDSSSPGPGSATAWADAWSAARAKAAAESSSPDVPAKYRQLMRDFYNAE